MKSIFSRSVLAFLFLLPGYVWASDFEAALSSETAQFTFRSDSSLIGWGGAELGFGLFYNENSDYLGQFSLFQRRQSSAENRLTHGVGARAYLGQMDEPNADLLAIAIGGEIRYTIPGLMPMAIFLRGHFAPSITSFSDTKEVLDTNLGFQIEVLPNTTAFAGYRNIEIELEDQPDQDLDDDSIHLGVRFSF